MDPLPTMNKIFSMVFQHERQDNFLIYDDSQVSINFVGFNKSNFKPSNSNFQQHISKLKVCTHYGRIGHTMEVFYRKYEFPPHFGKSSMVSNATTHDDDDVSFTQMLVENNGSSPIT